MMLGHATAGARTASPAAKGDGRTMVRSPSPPLILRAQASPRSTTSFLASPGPTQMSTSALLPSPMRVVPGTPVSLAGVAWRSTSPRPSPGACGQALAATTSGVPTVTAVAAVPALPASLASTVPSAPTAGAAAQQGSLTVPSLAAAAAAASVAGRQAGVSAGVMERAPPVPKEDSRSTAMSSAGRESLQTASTLPKAATLSPSSAWPVATVSKPAQQWQMSPRIANRHVTPPRAARVSCGAPMAAVVGGSMAAAIGSPAGAVAAMPCAAAGSSCLLTHPGVVVPVTASQPLPVVHATVPAAMLAVGAAPMPRPSSRSASPGARVRDVTLSSRGASPTTRRGHDCLVQQLQALHQAKTQAAAQQAACDQQIADRQDKVMRETLEALCGSPAGRGLAEVLKRWPSPRPEATSSTPEHPGGMGFGSSAPYAVPQAGSLDSTITEVTGSPGTGATTTATGGSSNSHSNSYGSGPPPASPASAALSQQPQSASVPCIATAAATGESVSPGTVGVGSDRDIGATGGTGSEPTSGAVAAATATVAAIAAASAVYSPREALNNSGLSAPHLVQEDEEESLLGASSPVPITVATAPAPAVEERPDSLFSAPPAPMPREALGPATSPAASLPEHVPSSLPFAAPRRQPVSARSTPTQRRDSPQRAPASARRAPVSVAGAAVAQAKSQLPRPPQQRTASPGPPRGGGNSSARAERRSVSPSQTRLTDEMQHELQRASEELSAIADMLTAKSFRELRQLQKPADVVVRIFEATLLLLGIEDPRTKVTTGFSPVLSFRRNVTQDKLKGIDLMKLSLAQFRRAQKWVLEMGCSEEEMQVVCNAAVPLVMWCRLVLATLARTKFQGRSEVNAALLASSNGMEEYSLTPADNESMTSVGAAGTAAFAVAEAECRLPEVSELNASANAPLELGPRGDSASPSEGERTRGYCGYLVVSPDLSRLSPNEMRQVKELSVSRPEVGSITFHGTTDCTGLDIESLVHLEVGEVLVYPMPGSKPVVGQGLNKRATVTMYQCWPPNGRGNLEDEKAQQRYRWKIQQMTEDKHAKFIDYDCNTGVWKFQVEHF